MKDIEKSDFGIDIRIKKDDIYKDEDISIVAGSKKRRYAKSPKFGEGRDLRDKFTLAKPDKRTFL